MKKLLIKTSLLLTASVGVLSAQSIVVSDDFSSGVRNVQNLPDQMQWFSSGRSQDLFVEDNELVLNRNNNSLRNTGALAYFTDSGTISIPSGGSLSVSFNFIVNGAIDNDNRFWIGLYNSGGTRITEDAFVENDNGDRFMTHPNFLDYSGYEASMNLGQDPDAETIGSRLRRRLPDHGSERLLTTTGSVGLGSVNPPGMSGMALFDDTVYNMEFLITNEGSQIRTTITVTGGDLLEQQTMTAADPQSGTVAFDTFVIWTSRFGSETAFNDEFIFQDFTVTFVPEPATVTLLIGTMALGASLIVRRRRKA
jgi:hypothetical protein